AHRGTGADDEWIACHACRTGTCQGIIKGNESIGCLAKQSGRYIFCSKVATEEETCGNRNENPGPNDGSDHEYAYCDPKGGLRKRNPPIWVGVYEANAIALEIEKVVTPRPMTHDLLKNMLVGLDANVRKVVVTNIK